ncbi:hypothetical protein NL676_011324 [Syzygium grande]|nr:hypothetical protein NL676_011324 [Syzygium grande]
MDQSSVPEKQTPVASQATNFPRQDARNTRQTPRECGKSPARKPPTLSAELPHAGTTCKAANRPSLPCTSSNCPNPATATKTPRAGEKPHTILVIAPKARQSPPSQIEQTKTRPHNKKKKKEEADLRSSHVTEAERGSRPPKRKTNRTPISLSTAAKERTGEANAKPRERKCGRGVRIAHPLAPLGQCSSRWRPCIGGPREAERREGEGRERERGGQRDERTGGGGEEELLPAELCAAVAAIKAGARRGQNRK